jgi:hypothetical protein
MNETSTKSMDEELPPTAQEVASVYEGASDDRVNEGAPSRGDAEPSGTATQPDSSAPSGTAALPDNAASSGTAPLPDNAAPSGTAPLPDNAAPSSTAPASGAPSRPSPNNEALQPGALPLPGMNNLRLRMKVWTDPSTSKRYLMPMGFMRDIVNGQPISDVMYAYAMSDDDTKLVVLSAAEWNSLSFFYFREDGYAPRATPRAMDTLP